MNHFKYLIALIFISNLALPSKVLAESPLRHFEAYEIPEAGLIVYNPSSPEWKIDFNKSTGGNAVLLSTPKNYFPPTVVEIRLNPKHPINSNELSQASLVIANILRKKTNALTIQDDTLQPIEYGNISALKDDFDIIFEDKELSIRHIIGRMPSGHIITMMATTPKYQSDAIEFMLSKIYSNLEEIQLSSGGANPRQSH